MLPLVDMHCHLLAGLDDGPHTQEDAVAMCRIAVDEGIRLAAATAHQNEHWSAVNPAGIREAASRLAAALRGLGLDLAVFPCAEVMLHADVEAAWRRGDLLSVADRGQYLLIEMPHGLSVRVHHVVRDLCRAGVRPILAHAERQPELLHEPGRVEELIQAGCLIQVNAGSVTEPPSGRDARALKDWFRRGVVHVLGSDGHSPRHRRPQMADAYRRIAAWAGPGVADRVCSSHGTAILHGLALRLAGPSPRRTRWFAFW